MVVAMHVAQKVVVIIKLEQWVYSLMAALACTCMVVAMHVAQKVVVIIKLEQWVYSLMAALAPHL